MTREGFNSRLALEKETLLRLPPLTNDDAVEIGVIATKLRKQKMLSIEIQIRVGSWIVFQASLEGSTLENDGWMNREAAVILLKHHSTWYEGVYAEEREVDWQNENDLSEGTQAIHGGAIPLVINKRLKGVLIISSLTQAENCLFAFQVLTDFFSEKVKEF